MRPSIKQHFQNYKAANNSSELCFLCGTALLSQDRFDFAVEEQWRADYDHILCKAKYPIYSAHPGNFIPTCHFCNTKAKRDKDLLCCCSNNRRLAFYPLPPANESCYIYMAVVPSFRTIEELMDGKWENPICSAKVTFTGAPPDILEKIGVWKEVYEVPSRVEQRITTNFCETLSAELKPTSSIDFRTQLERQAATLPSDYKRSEWRFWWYKVYENLNSLGNEKLDDVWSIIQWKLEQSNDADMEATFGV